MVLPLYHYQLRSLHLMQSMERVPSIENLIHAKSFISKGGVIADIVGMVQRRPTCSAQAAYTFPGQDCADHRADSVNER